MIERVILPKNSAQILSDFLFQVKGDTMEVTATDSETTLKCSIPLAQSDGDCLFAIQAKEFLNILKEIPEQPLTIDIAPGTLQVDLTYQNGHISLQGEAGESFPQMKTGEGDSTKIRIASPVFRKALAAALSAAATEDNRRVMTGLFMDVMPKDLSVVASDGHKLVCFKIDCDTNDTTASFLVPRKPANLLRSIIEKMEADIELTMFADGNCMISSEGFSMCCRLMQERYPNYKNVIPQNNDNVAVVDRAALQSAARRVLVASDKATCLIKFNLEANQMTLITENLSRAQSAEERMVCEYTGQPMRIGFRGDYLLELLSNVQSENVDIKLADPARAGLIIPSAQEQGTDLTMLLMPLIITN